jgi:hypothetical protein
MSQIIGYNFWGLGHYQSPSPPVRNIYHVEIKNSIIDELNIRERIDVDTSNTKNNWQIDTRLLAKFMDDLEAGNVQNEGIQIVKFAIKRRKVDELNPITLGYLDFVNDSEVEYTDYTQGNDTYIYSIVPVGENDLEGKPTEVQIESDFVGWWIVDKDTNEVLGFDKFFDNNPSVETQLNQKRTVIETLTGLPQVFYTGLPYSTFSLQAVFLPEENQRSYVEFKRILDKFINQHKPFLVKGSTGELYVCDISNLRKSTPQNAYKGFDYISLTVDALEVMSYDEYMTQE